MWSLKSENNVYEILALGSFDVLTVVHVTRLADRDWETQSEDFLLTRKFPMSSFTVLKDRITQDDRRFKKMGYFGFTKLVMINYLKRNNIDHFRRDFGYW